MRAFRAPGGPALALEHSEIGQKEKTMRNEQAHENKGSKEGLLGMLMGLVLVAGAILSLGVAPTELDRNFIDVGKPEAAGVVSTPPDNISPAETIAANNTVDASSSLDLQLD
jgi:hypothetical protein